MNGMNRTPRVLIADDDEINLLLLREAMEAAGFAVTTVADGAEALREGCTGRFDVALLDVSMPQLDGYAVCRALRAAPLTSHLPVIMITSRDDSASIDRAYDAGATDFISKPINWHLIPHRLRYVLRSSASEARIRELAYVDAATGLPNRAAAVQRLTQALDAGDDQPSTHGLAVLSLELPGIRRIGESFGAPVGTGVLMSVARKLPAALRAELPGAALIDCARTGDVEFLVTMCGNQPRDAALKLAERTVRWFRDAVAFNGHEFFLEPMIGIAVHPEHGRDAETLMRCAATARDHAARERHTSLEVYTEALGVTSRDRLALDAELRRAVRDEELVLHFQPRIRTADGGLAGVEALLRWFHPERGAVPPAAFIPLAEESGLIFEIDAWVVRAACRQLRNWRDAGLRTSIAVNISGKHFLGGDPVSTIEREAAAAGIDPAGLTVEITESVLIHDTERAQGRLQRLRSLGCKVAIDDFGTGYSSLAYLQRLRADALKIDRAFIEWVHEREADAAIVRAILGLSRSLGMTVTAEGVETQPQLDWLRANGCDDVQGYLTGRPSPAHEILRRYAPDDPVALRLGALA